MSASGPSRSIKRINAAKDQSHYITETLPHLARNLITVFAIAVVVWVFCSALRLGVEYSVEHLFDPVAHGKPYALWVLLGVLVTGGILRGLLIQLPSWRSSEGDGVATALGDFHATYKETELGSPRRHDKPTVTEAARRVVMTMLTVGTGGSGGLEAPVLPIGEQLAAWVSKLLRNTSVDDLRAFQMAGMAAAITCLLDAPFTATVFAAEVLFTDRIIYRMAIYSLMASVFAYALNNHFLAFEPLFHISQHSHIYSLREYAQVALVGTVISAPAGLGVQWVFQKLRRLVHGVPPVVRPALGALGAGIIAVAMWQFLGIEPRHVLGIGERSLKELLTEQGNPLLQVWWVLALLMLTKSLTTGLTLMSGGSAGLLVPAMFMGGVSGAAVHYLLASMGIYAGPNANLFIVSGIASALVAVIEVPLAAICFVLEVFGARFGPPAIVAVALCHLLVRRLRLYERNQTDKPSFSPKTCQSLPV